MSNKMVGKLMFSTVIGLLFAGLQAQAATKTWIASPATNNWATGANWGGTAPVASDSLMFQTSTVMSQVNDLASALNFAGITFSNGASAFTLGGNSITLDGPVTNNAANTQTINFPIALSGDRTVVGASGTLVLNGVISGGYALTKLGGGTLTLGTSNTYSGGTTIDAGIIVAGVATALGSGSVTLNGGTLRGGGFIVANNIVVGSGGGTLTTSGGGTFTLTGTLSGAGNLALGGAGQSSSTINPQFSANTMTSGTITLNPNNGICRIKSTTTSSAVLDWVFNGGGTDVGGTFYWGSYSGSGTYSAYNNNSGTTLYVIGGNNHDATFSGAQNQTGTGQVLSFLKVGTGYQIFSGNSGYTGTTTVEDGSLIAGAAVSVNTAGPFGNASSAIVLGDVASVTNNLNPALLIGGAYTMARAVTVGATNSATSGTFTLGGLSTNSATFSGAVTLNQSCIVTQASGGTLTLSGGVLSGGGSQALTMMGGGTLVLAASNTYTGATTVNNGTVLVNGVLATGSTVTVNSGVLGGSGTINGATTVSNVAALTPRPAGGSATTLKFGGNLTLTNASVNFTVSASGSGSNDKVMLGSGSTLTLDESDTINISVAGALDTVSDYTLFAASGGSLNMATTPVLKTNGVTVSQGAAGSFMITNAGTSVLLHYVQPSTPPAINSTNASPGTLAHGEQTTVTVNVTPYAGQTISSVTVALDGLAGVGDPVTLTGPGGDGTGNWTGAFTAARAVAPGLYLISGSVNQNDGASVPWSVSVTVAPTNAVWGGGGSDNKWSTAANWNAGSGPAPGMGDSLVFAGASQLTNNMDAGVSVPALTFDGSAGGFVITNAANTLTLTGGLTNDSASPQALNVPVVLSAAPNIVAASGDIALNQPVSGGSALVKVGSGTLTLSASNTCSGATTIGAGTLAIAGIGQLGGGTYSAAITNNGALNWNGSANQTLSGAITGSGWLSHGGSGVLTLSGANTYGGGTTNSAGTLKFSNASAFGSGTLALNGGTIQAGGGYTLANNIVVVGATTFDMASANITLSSNISGSAALTFNNSAAAATVSLNGNNSGYSGTLTLNNNNAVSFNSANAGSTNAAWVFNDGNAGRVRINIAGGGTINFGSISGPGQIGSLIAATATTLSVGGLGTSTTFSGAIANGSGTLALTKVGAGSLSLTGVNTYTGPTAVSNGALIVNGSLYSNSAVTVVSGATLGGSGTVGGVVTTMSGATLQPGVNGAGTLTLGQTPVLSGGTWVASVATNGASTALSVSGSLSVSSMAFILTNGTNLSKLVSSYTIATATNVTGRFQSHNLPSGWGVQYNSTSIALVQMPGGTLLIVR